MKSLHPLMRGKAGAEQGTATGMGHTGSDVDVDVKQCPAAFPMGLTPLFSVANSGAAGSARPTCAAGVSTFGFSGTMVGRCRLTPCSPHAHPRLPALGLSA